MKNNERIPSEDLHVREHVFGKSGLYIVRRDGSGITVKEADLRPAAGLK